MRDEPVTAETPPEIAFVPPDALGLAWDDARRWLEEPVGANNGIETVEDVAVQCLQGITQLWIVARGRKVIGAVVTSLIRYPQMSTLRMAYLGGEDLASWVDPLVDVMEQYARDHGCRGVEFSGRRGWKRLFRERGAREFGMRFWKDLD